MRGSAHLRHNLSRDLNRATGPLMRPGTNRVGRTHGPKRATIHYRLAIWADWVAFGLECDKLAHRVALSPRSQRQPGHFFGDIASALPGQRETANFHNTCLGILEASACSCAICQPRSQFKLGSVQATMSASRLRIQGITSWPTTPAWCRTIQ